VLKALLGIIHFNLAELSSACTIRLLLFNELRGESRPALLRNNTIVDPQPDINLIPSQLASAARVTAFKALFEALSTSITKRSAQHMQSR
jgi:hypothetical protein